MAKGDPPLVMLRKAERKLVGVQKNLAECSQALGGATDDLVMQCIALKEAIIKRFETSGGIYPNS